MDPGKVMDKIENEVMKWDNEEEDVFFWIRTNSSIVIVQWKCEHFNDS